MKTRILDLIQGKIDEALKQYTQFLTWGTANEYNSWRFHATRLADIKSEIEQLEG